MLALDTRSLTMMGVALSTLMALALLYMRQLYPARYRGLSYWAAASVKWIGASLLFAGWGRLPYLLSEIVPSTLLLLATITYHIGCKRFFNRPARWWPWLALLALSIATLAWYTYVQRYWPAQLRLMIVVTIGIHLATLVFLQRHGTATFAVRLVQATLALHIAVLIYRLASTFTGRAGLHVMEATLEQSLYVGAYVLIVLLLSLGALLMATDRLSQELRQAAALDPLTRVLNRHAVLREGEKALSRSRRAGRPVCLLLLDLDHFKQVNDTHGHQHGDAALVHFARQTQATLRAGGRFGRYGGEEFLAVLPDTTLVEALQTTQRIHAFTAADHPLSCRCSIGLAESRPEDTLLAMLHRADDALYQAKARGRNQTCTD